MKIARWVVRVLAIVNLLPLCLYAYIWMIGRRWIGPPESVQAAQMVFFIFLGFLALELGLILLLILLKKRSPKEKI